MHSNKLITEVHMLRSSTPDKAVLGSWTCTMRERHQVLDWWRHICFGSEKHSQKKGALIPYQVPFQEASSGGAPKEHVRTRALQSTSELSRALHGLRLEPPKPF